MQLFMVICFGFVLVALGLYTNAFPLTHDQTTQINEGSRPMHNTTSSFRTGITVNDIQTILEPFILILKKQPNIPTLKLVNRIVSKISKLNDTTQNLHTELIKELKADEKLRILVDGLELENRTKTPTLEETQLPKLTTYSLLVGRKGFNTDGTAATETTVYKEETKFKSPSSTTNGNVDIRWPLLKYDLLEYTPHDDFTALDDDQSDIEIPLNQDTDEPPTKTTPLNTTSQKTALVTETTSTSSPKRHVGDEIKNLLPSLRQYLLASLKNFMRTYYDVMQSIKSTPISYKYKQDPTTTTGGIW